MRTLKEEIENNREKGYHHSKIDQMQLLAWLGEQTLIEDENKRLKAEINKLRYEFSAT